VRQLIRSGSIRRQNARFELARGRDEASVTLTSRRIDDEQRGDSVRPGNRELRGEMSSPRMAGHNCPFDPELVEHRDCVGNVARNGERTVERRWLRPALLVPDPAVSGRLSIELRHVVGEAWSPVQQEQREAGAILHAADVADIRVRYERVLTHA
jgi:hypothetical protein